LKATTVHDISQTALALPGVSEGTHFRLLSYKVRDRTFATIQKGGTHAIVHVDRDTAEASAASSPTSQQVISRSNGKVFVGLRVDLTATAPSVMQQLVRAAWRNRAPKRLVAEHEGEVG
jgi:hypothetical protein